MNTKTFATLGLGIVLLGFVVGMCLGAAGCQSSGTAPTGDTLVDPTVDLAGQAPPSVDLASASSADLAVFDTPPDLATSVSPPDLETAASPPDLSTPPDMAQPSYGLAGSYTSLSLIAGQPGGRGYVDGPGTSARFGGLSFVAADATGNLYVGDALNLTIRRIAADTGAVTTLAGAVGQTGTTDGVGSAARLQSPFAGAVAGNTLYFTDNGRVRSLDLTTRQVTTIATGGTQIGIAVVAHGTAQARLIVSAPSTFYSIDLATKQRTTLTSSVVSTPYHLAWDGANGIYFTDGRTVGRFDLVTNAVSVVAGVGNAVGTADGAGSAARFMRSRGITRGPDGNFYVTDTEYQTETIRRVTPSGEVTTIAGSATQAGYVDGPLSTARFAGLEGIAVRNGNLVVADREAHAVREVSASGVSRVAGVYPGVGDAQGETGTQARFNQPSYVSRSLGGSVVYVSDLANGVFKQVRVSDGQTVTLLGRAPIGSPPVDGPRASATTYHPGASVVIQAGDGKTYVFFADGAALRYYNINDGVAVTVAGSATQVGTVDGTFTAARFVAINAMAWDGGTYLYLADQAGTIRRYHLGNGQVVTIAGAANLSGNADGIGGAARFGGGGVYGMGFNNAANALYLSDTGNNTIRRLALSNFEVNTIAGNGTQGAADGVGAAARFMAPRGLTYPGGAYIYVADTANRLIRRVRVDTFAVDTIAGRKDHAQVLQGGQPFGFNLPYGIAAVNLSADQLKSDLVITDQGESPILKLQ